MSKVEFTYYLHDDSDTFEMAADLRSQHPDVFDEELLEKMGRPFYEVTLTCEVDTDTGDVVILRAV